MHGIDVNVELKRGFGRMLLQGVKKVADVLKTQI
jgi:hypothetical protein